MGHKKRLSAMGLTSGFTPCGRTNPPNAHEGSTLSPAQAAAAVIIRTAVISIFIFIICWLICMYGYFHKVSQKVPHSQILRLLLRFSSHRLMFLETSLSVSLKVMFSFLSHMWRSVK